MRSVLALADAGGVDASSDRVSKMEPALARPAIEELE